MSGTARALPLRPRCDPLPFAAIAKALEGAGTRARSERGRVLREVYREYAGRAAHPYGFRPFCQQYNLWEKQRFAEEIEEHKASHAFWDGVAAPKSRVTAIAGELAHISVKGGALRVWDGSRESWFEPGTRMLEGLVCASWGGAVTLDALRFCADHKVPIVFVDWPSGLLSFGGWPPKHNAALVRAQCAANPVRIAAVIVAQKLRHSHAAGRLTESEVQGFCGALGKARSLDQVIKIEARAARLYWGRIKIEPQYRGKIPHNWRIWAGRPSGFARGPRGARTPINALLNVAYSHEAGRVAAYLHAAGAALSIGFLHTDKPARASLVYDALEPLRPLINERVFAWIERKKFARADFIRLNDGELRLQPGLLKALVQETTLPQADIDRACGFIIRLLGARLPQRKSR